MLFNLHGQDQSNTYQESYGDFRTIADTANFLIVLPNGVKDPLLPNNHGLGWNTWGKGSKVDDVGFLLSVLDTLKRHYTIDPNRVYSTGFSNGGFMSYELAGHLSNRIAAIGSVSGGLITADVASCTPPRPVPVLEIHGTSDKYVPYPGDADKAPVDTLLAHWVRVNGCVTSPAPTFKPLPNKNTTDGCTVDTIVWSGGRYGSTVVHYRITGGGHAWPGTSHTDGDKPIDRDFNASVAIWRFLRPLRLAHFQGLDINLALNQPVTVSSSSATTMLGPNAVDGKAATRWSSKYTNQEWLYVDLGASYNVNRVKITWQTAYGKDFDVEVSTDALTWTPLQSVTGNTKLVNDLTGLSGTGRYVRMNGKARGTVYGYSIFELEVYGLPATPPQILAAQKVQTTQLAQVADAGELIVFPNPATATSTVTLSGVATFPATADIYDAQGTRLHSLQLTQACDALDVSKLTTGLYTIRVSSQQRVQTARLQKN